jgi:NTP pyrophosphatase (non-canonical NTP hydrolase)
MKISEFQKAADATDISSRAPWVGLNQNLFGLIEKVGGISRAMKNRLRDKGSYSVATFKADMQKEIGEAFWYLSAVATHFNLDLEKIAEENLASNRNRWGGHRDEQGRLFHYRGTGDALVSESFPNKMQLVFNSTSGPNQVSWLPVTDVWVDGIPFGDPVDDNSKSDDNYRYHDILHFAFACYLDWSPVVRKLIQTKRKSDLTIDKFEDGARARDTEEAVSNAIHHYARENHFFDGAKHLDTAFLNRIQLLVIDLEVRDRSTSEWEKCILAAYDIFRKLVRNNGGCVDVEFGKPRLNYSSKIANSARK